MRLPILAGSVIAGWLRTTAAARAPRRSAAGSRSARPVAMAYLPMYGNTNVSKRARRLARVLVDRLRFHVQPLAGDRLESVRLRCPLGLPLGAGVHLGGDQLPGLVPLFAGLLQGHVGV